MTLIQLAMLVVSRQIKLLNPQTVEQRVGLLGTLQQGHLQNLAWYCYFCTKLLRLRKKIGGYAC